MKNKMAVMLYILIAFTVVFMAYDFHDITSREVSGRAIKQLDEGVIKAYKEQFDTKQPYSYLWGIKEAKKKVLKKQKTKKKSTILQVTQKGSELCIGKECYRFLGIYNKNGVDYGSFYSKKFKKKLRDFTEEQVLDKGLFVKEIRNNELVVAERNSTREWHFRIFDVNAAKYKPKDRK